MEPDRTPLILWQHWRSKDTLEALLGFPMPADGQQRVSHEPIGDDDDGRVADTVSDLRELFHRRPRLTVFPTKDKYGRQAP
jgi:hypothetical protein